jgi:hypothetical protein
VARRVAEQLHPERLHPRLTHGKNGSGDHRARISGCDLGRADLLVFVIRLHNGIEDIVDVIRLSHF